MAELDSSVYMYYDVISYNTASILCGSFIFFGGGVHKAYGIEPKSPAKP